MITAFFHDHYAIQLIFLSIMGFLAGFVDAIAGGGGFISTPALIFTGMPIVDVLGTTKFQASVGTSVAVYKYYQNGFIHLLTVLRGLISGFLGVLTGATAVLYIDNQYMKYILPFLLLSVFLFNVFNKNLGVHPGVKRIKESLFFPLFGFFLGFYDAFVGPGTGNFWVISIVFFLGYTFLEASGYAKVLNLKSNLFAVAVFWYSGNINFTLGLVMAIGQIFGGYLGAHAAILKGSKLIRPFFMTIMLVNILASFYTLIF